MASGRRRNQPAAPAPHAELTTVIHFDLPAAAELTTVTHFVLPGAAELTTVTPLFFRGPQN